MSERVPACFDPAITTVKMFSHAFDRMKYDLIFVFGGRESRKTYALELMRGGVANRILFSVARFDIRRFHNLGLPAGEQMVRLRAQLSPRDRHFFADYDGVTVSVCRIPYYPFGTMREVLALSGWLQLHPEITRIALLSDRYHLRRIRVLSNSLIKGIEVELIAAPQTAAVRAPRLVSRMTEPIKYLLYWAFLTVFTPRPLMPTGELFRLTRNGSLPLQSREHE